MQTAQDHWFPCSFFVIGRVQVSTGARDLLSDEDIIKALTRHAHCDFGEVYYHHHLGNLHNIAESQRVVTSIYRSQAGYSFYVMTWLDDFDPRTVIQIR